MSTFLQALVLTASLLSCALAIPAIPARQTAAPTRGSLHPGNIKGIVPTTSGQIGVNPVDSDLGDASSYSGYIIGVDTQYISEVFTTHPSTTTSIISSTKWLAHDTKYLDSASSTVVAVSTATADADGLSKGDISLVFSEGVALAIHTSATGAIGACNAVSKRDLDGAVLTCLMKQAVKAAKEGILEKFVQSQVIEKWGLEIAKGATAITEGLAGLTASETASAIVLLTSIAILIGKMEHGETAPAALAKINQPKAGFGGITTTAAVCTGSKEKDQESPLCTDDNCQGLQKEICTTGPSKNCPCLLIATESPPQQGSWAFLVAQQDFLSGVLSETTASCTISSVTMTLSGWKGPPVMTNCMCGPIMVQTQEAVSGKVTTTFCQTGGSSASAPHGYTNIGGPSTAKTAPTHTPNAPTPVGPAQGVPTCGNGLFFQRSDAADSAKTFCNQLAKDGSWAKGPQSLKFSNVKIYNKDRTMNPHQEFALGMSPNAAWCPKDLTLDSLAKTMTVDRCVANIMTGVDGCSPFLAPQNGLFLKTVGLSYEDCIQWQVDIVEA